jgi:hypothetical protein
MGRFSHGSHDGRSSEGARGEYAQQEKTDETGKFCSLGLSCGAVCPANNRFGIRLA